jgi:hypothetical protein
MKNEKNCSLQLFKHALWIRVTFLMKLDQNFIQKFKILEKWLPAMDLGAVASCQNAAISKNQVK